MSGVDAPPAEMKALALIKHEHAKKTERYVFLETKEVRFKVLSLSSRPGTIYVPGSGM